MSNQDIAFDTAHDDVDAAFFVLALASCAVYGAALFVGFLIGALLT